MENCIYVLFKWEYFNRNGKRLPYPYSACLLKYSPILQKSKSQYYCHSYYFFSTDRARLDSLIFTRSKMPLFAMCKK